MRTVVFLALAVFSAAGAAWAQGIEVPDGIPPHPVLEGPGEPGAPGWAPSGGGGGYGGDGGRGGGDAGRGAGAAGAGGDAAGGGVAAAPIEGGSQALNTLARQSYGATAISSAQEMGVNPETTAAFANAESRFRNVAVANGTTSAHGVWQVTQGTWDDTVRMGNLGFTQADRNDPEAQAVVANNVIRRYSAATQNAIGREVTVADSYASYVFGPAVGPRLATASNDAPLSAIVPATSLRNNGMSSWSVGQWRGYANNSLGPAASQPALLPRT